MACRTHTTVLYLDEDVPIILFGKQIGLFSEDYTKYISMLCT